MPKDMMKGEANCASTCMKGGGKGGMKSGGGKRMGGGKKKGGKKK